MGVVKIDKKWVRWTENDALLAIARTLALIHRENLCIMRALTYPKQEEKIKEWEKVFEDIWGKIENEG